LFPQTYHKRSFFFLVCFLSFLVIEFQNCGNKHDHGSLLIKNALMYEVHTNEEIEQFVDMFLFICDVSLLSNPLQNAQQHQHTRTCKKKNHVVSLPIASYT